MLRIAYVTIIAAFLLLAAGCSALDGLLLTKREKEVVTASHTNRLAVVDSSGLTNFVTVVVPSATNTAIRFDVAPWVGAVQDVGGSIPYPGAGTAAILLGLLASLYRNVRQFKMNTALVDGIEAGRMQILETEAMGVAADDMLRDALIRSQQRARVDQDVARMVAKRTGKTR
jgi:hypothetical protein